MWLQAIIIAGIATYFIALAMIGPKIWLFYQLWTRDLIEKDSGLLKTALAYTAGMPLACVLLLIALISVGESLGHVSGTLDHEGLAYVAGLCVIVALCIVAVSLRLFVAHMAIYRRSYAT